MSPPVSTTQLQSSSSSAHIYQSVSSNNTQQFYHNHHHHQQQSGAMPLKQGKDMANVASFWDCYEHICSLQNLVPMQSLKASLASEGGTVLNINADKLRSADWDPIYGALRVNKGLKKISIVSNYNPQNDNDETSRLVKGFAKLKKPPSIRNKDRIKELCRSIKDCLAISHGLNHLEFYNLPMTAKDLAHVAKGLRSNKTLKMLSLERCCIGDEGLATICKDIQSSNNLNRVNFSSCDLTHEGAEILANLIKVQALKRHNEAWKDSLRYGRPDLDSMFGIRRITINSNPKIGDRGVFLLAEAFKSDLWLKALDLQDCGITTQGANFLLDGLKFNAMMHVLDVRLNVKIDRDTLQKIMEQVMINSSGHSTDYEWMDLTQAAAISMNIAAKPAKDSTKQATGTEINQSSQAAQKQSDLKKRRITNASFSKKTQFMSMAGNSLNRMKRCKSTGSVIFNKSALSNTSSHHNHKDNNNHHHHSHDNHSGGIPWRTAARANRYRVSTSCAQRKVGASSFREADDDDEYEEEEDDGNYDDLVDDHTNNKENMEACDDNVEFVETDNRHRSVKGGSVVNSTFADSRNGLSSVNTVNRQTHRKQASEKNEFVSNLDKIKNMSVKDLLVILQREQESKTQLEDMLIKLQEDNTRFKSQISILRSKVDHQQQELQSQKRNRNNQSTMNRTLLDDDKALEIIELTLYKYQSFLDFLRNAGFGKLIEMGDLNQQEQQQQHVSNKSSKSAMKAAAKVSKSSSSSSKRQTLSPATSKLSDQQKYYLEKINKTKSKMNKNMLESTKNYSMSESRGNFAENIEGFINHDMIDKSLINGQDSAENHHIDTLLSNALEISRSYRRMNSSSVNNSVMSQYHYPKQHQRANDTNLLSEIEETNRESSSTHTTGPDASAQHDALHKQSNTLLMEYKGMKKGSMSSSTLINEDSILKPTKHPRNSKKVSKSPELELNTVLHKMGLADEKSVMSSGSAGERSQSRQDRSSGHDKSSAAQDRSSGTHDHSSGGAHDRSEGQEYSQNEHSHSNHHQSNNSSGHSHSQSKSRDMSIKKRQANYSQASTLSPANTIVAAGNLRHNQSNESVPPKPISRILQRSQNEVHEDDVSEILSDFDNQADENEPSSDKPVIFVTSKLKGNEGREDIEFEIDEENEFYEEEEDEGEEGEDEEGEGEEYEDEVEEISEVQ